MGGKSESHFSEHFFIKIHKYHIHLRIHSKNILYSLTDWYLVVFTQLVFNVKLGKDRRQSVFFVDQVIIMTKELSDNSNLTFVGPDF